MMWYGGGGWWMLLWMLLFWGGVILMILWAVRALPGGGRPDDRSGRNRALEILEERFARSEIDREEFEQRRSVIERQ